jgi:hypothetical protein
VDDFKLYHKVIDINGEWEGYIDAINKQGKIRVKTPSGYQWVFPFQITHKKEYKKPEAINKKTDLRFF